MMHTAIAFKNHGGLGQNSASQPSQATLMSWWVGSQRLYGEPFGQPKSFTEDHPNGEGQLPAASRQMHHAVDPRPVPGPGPTVADKGGDGMTKFLLFPGNISFTSNASDCLVPLLNEARTFYTCSLLPVIL